MVTYCRVPKLFRFLSRLGHPVQDMKLNKTKVRCILRQNRKGAATKEISRDVKVSQRRYNRSSKDSGIAGGSLSYQDRLR